MSASELPTSDQSDAVIGPSKKRDLAELCGVYALILLVVWTPRPWQTLLFAATVITTAFIIWISYEGLRPMGLCSRNLRPSLWVVGLALVLSVAAGLMAGRLHTLQMPSTTFLFIRKYGVYVVWAGVQQLILQSVCLSRVLRLIPNATSAAGVAAVLFAIAHLPNPFLMVVTLTCGLASCLFFAHYRNLWPLAVAHAILGVSIAITIPGPLHHNMRVGLSYLHYVDRSALSQSTQSAKPQRPN